MPLLDVVGLSARYGEVTAVHQVSLSVNEGEIVSLLGANGAGKTSTLMALSGLIHRTGGVRFRGIDLMPMAPHTIARHGLVQVPEGRRVFADMTVEDNLIVGAIANKDSAKRREGLERAYELFPRLAERKSQLAGSMSGGEQQMVAIGRALMMAPSMMMLDEPSLGLAPSLVDATFDSIRKVRGEGVSILLVEQNAGEALEIADRAYVMEQGRIVLEGSSADVSVDPLVKEAYLGI